MLQPSTKKHTPEMESRLDLIRVICYATFVTQCVTERIVNYNHFFLHQFETRHGLQVRVRLMRSDDAAYLVDIFEHMSADSRYQRFHTPLENPSPERIWREAMEIATADPSAQTCFLAFADLPSQKNAPIGAARYVIVEPGMAEAALSVRDDGQRQGIGTQLLCILADAARDAGLEKLTASIQNENLGIWEALRRLPYPVKRQVTGADSDVIVDLTGQMEDHSPQFPSTAVPEPNCEN